MKIKPIYPRHLMHGECFHPRLFVWSSGCTNQLFHLRQQPKAFFANLPSKHSFELMHLISLASAAG